MINNLDSYGSALLFADDRTLVTMSGDTVEAAFHAEHNFGSIRPKAWFSANKLKLNKRETIETLVHLEQDQTFRILQPNSDLVSWKLSWEHHIKAVTVKLR